MKTISLKEFTEIIQADEALSARLAGCPDAETALAAVRRMAAEQGYTLAEPARVEALSDDDLDAVAGGWNPFYRQDDRELNPYSWFVTFLRFLERRGTDTGEIPLPGTLSGDDASMRR